MTDFAQKVNSFWVPSGEVGVFFLGQAGFLFKTAAGTLIAVDIYLSDCCFRYFGFKRQMAQLLQPYDLEFDLVLASHAHYDHFDPDAVPLLMDNGRTRLVAAYDVEAECRRLHLQKNITYMKVDDVFEHEQLTIRAVACDHGPETPDALGFLLDFDGKKVYLTGDSAFRPEIWQNTALRNVDLLLLPINGAFGNLNADEAVEASKLLTPRLTIPCHYGNFAAHGGDPQRFIDLAMQNNIPRHIMRQGEAIRI